MKRCSKCGEVKEKNNFSKNKNTADGLQFNCKSCFKSYRLANIESLSIQNKAYYERNKEYINTRNKNYYETNKEFVLTQQKKYVEQNKQSVAKYKKRYHYKRLSEDPIYRAVQNLRSRLSKTCSSIAVGKNFKTLESIGITSYELKLYIESLFTEGMTWENYGFGNDKWSIDHIKPLRTAESIDDVFKLNHYTNLQPMWNPENFAKGGKWEFNY
jgi:hypothetical protein